MSEIQAERKKEMKSKVVRKEGKIENKMQTNTKKSPAFKIN